MKKEMVDYNIKTFGNISIGIHGREIPKLAASTDTVEYWKLGKAYRPHPASVSN